MAQTTIRGQTARACLRQPRATAAVPRTNLPPGKHGAEAAALSAATTRPIFRGASLRPSATRCAPAASTAVYGTVEDAVAVGAPPPADTPQARPCGELPRWLDTHREIVEDKTVMLYCTGGIRCERAAVSNMQRLNLAQVSRQVLDHCT